MAKTRLDEAMEALFTDECARYRGAFDAGELSYIRAALAHYIPDTPAPNEETHVRVRMAYAVDIQGSVDVRGWRFDDGAKQPTDQDLSEYCGESLCHPMNLGWLGAWLPRPQQGKSEIECDLEAER